MIKQLTKIGNSLGIIIERPILELLNIDRETPLELTTDGDGLIIRPVRPDARAKRIREASTRVADRHAEAFERLAK